MPTRLPEPLLSDAMTRLPAWSGDPDGIHGRFTLDADHRRRLAADITELADRTEHPIAVEQLADGLEVSLVTGEVDGVSEVDIALATRITDLASGAAVQLIPQQRRADLDSPVTTYALAVDGDEQTWWHDRDRVEPVMGVPATEAGLMPVPLPDTAPQEPEPGVEAEQEPRGGEPFGFHLRGPGDPD